MWPLVGIILMPVLWSLTRHRWSAGLVPAMYALMATRGLIESGAVYFERTEVFGVVLWLAAAIPHYLAGIVAWYAKSSRRVFIGIPLLCLLLIIPPFMLVGWAHPLLASGLVFPHAGLWSLALCLLLMIAIAHLLPKPKTLLILVGCVALQAYFRYTPPAINITPDWRVHYTDVQEVITPEPLKALRRQWSLQNMLDSEKVQVFPESVGGIWDDFLASTWTYTVPEDMTVLLGAFILQNHHWRNVVIAVNHDDASVIYTQRLPMTGGMFNPFSQTHFSADWLGDSTATVAGQRVGFAMCFEHVVLWPMIQTTAAKPTLVYAPASIWWASSQLQNAQRQSLRLWQLWLGVPVIESINGVKS